MLRSYRPTNAWDVKVVQGLESRLAPLFPVVNTGQGRAVYALLPRKLTALTFQAFSDAFDLCKMADVAGRPYFGCHKLGAFPRQYRNSRLGER